jgi:hypothetical protein
MQTRNVFSNAYQGFFHKAYKIHGTPEDRQAAAISVHQSKKPSEYVLSITPENSTETLVLFYKQKAALAKLKKVKGSDGHERYDVGKIARFIGNETVKFDEIGIKPRGVICLDTEKAESLPKDSSIMSRFDKIINKYA